MGYDVFTEHTFDRATAAKGVSFTRDREGHRHTASNVTAKAEQHVRKTGRPPRRVDPAADGVIRRSLMRFEPLPDGTFKVTVGFPIPVESSCDTTGSMGNNVNTAMEVLPETYATISEVLPGRDLQLALGIFGDISDRFPMCRPQFEMTAEKIVEYITDLAPERDGGDYPEDQQYPAFAAAYLTYALINLYGLKYYHFLITDAPMHTRLDPDQLERIFGENVWKCLADKAYSPLRVSVSGYYVAGPGEQIDMKAAVKGWNTASSGPAVSSVRLRMIPGSSAVSVRVTQIFRPFSVSSVSDACASRSTGRTERIISFPSLSQADSSSSPSRGTRIRKSPAVTFHPSLSSVT